MPGRLEIPLLLLLAYALFFAAHATAAPVMQATAQDVTIVLHDEPCAIEAVGGERYFRAQWVARGGPVEGCWGLVPLTPELRVVVLYFTDRTMAAVPAALFQRVSTS